MRRWLIGNWKMNGGPDFARQWAADFAAARPAAKNDDLQVVVCPPLPFLPALAAALSPRVWTGAQDVSAVGEAGAHTGEVSASMAAACGARLALAGHSERRQARGETNSIVAAKLNCAIDAGLHCVLCVGETAEERPRAAAVTAAQLAAAVAGLPPAGFARLLLAYEPVWAIGSGKTPTPQEAKTTIAALRAALIEQSPQFGGTIPLLYGGSVDANNVAAFLREAGVGGFLAGGASLRAAAFARLCNIMEQE